MKRLLLLAGIALALLCPPVAAKWVRDPAPGTARDFWRIDDVTDALGDPVGVRLSTPFSASSSDAWGTAFVNFYCGEDYASVSVFPDVGFVSFPGQPSVLVEVDGQKSDVDILHRFGNDFFLFMGRGAQLVKRAIQEEMPVRMAVPIYKQGSAVFSWTMEGGAAALAEACQ